MQFQLPPDLSGGKIELKMDWGFSQNWMFLVWLKPQLFWDFKRYG
jgi:hypothetical protein